MNLHLVVSRLGKNDDIDGGMADLGKTMKLFLVSWPETIKSSPGSRFVGGDIQWQMFGQENQRMRLKILLSYWYYKDADLDALLKKYFQEPYPEIFADSGAFSAATQGAQITIKEYSDWVKRYSHLFAVYSNLDVIGDPVKTLENQHRLEDTGIQPLPVFHISSNYEALENYIDAGYKYIALGGLVPYANQPKVRMRFLIRAFQMAQGKSVYHGFGVTSWEVMSQLPWYSVDSSSWGQGFRFGQVPLFDEKHGRFVKVSLGSIKECSKASFLFEQLGFDWKDFAYRARNDRAKIAAVSALSYMQAEQYLRRKFGAIHIPGDGDRPGPQIHLADTSNFVNYRDADAGVRVFNASTSTTELARADADLKLHLAESQHGMGDIVRAKSVLDQSVEKKSPE